MSKPKVSASACLCDEKVLPISGKMQPPSEFFFYVRGKKLGLIDLMYICLQELVALMTKDGIEPDIKTFGCLATGCYRMADGLALLKDMKVMLPVSLLYRA